MREYAHNRLTDPVDAAALHALVPADRIRSSGGGSSDTGLSRPFIVVRSRVTSPVFRTAVSDGGVTIHVHDDPDSYHQIDLIIAEIQKIMNASGARWYGTTWVMDVQEQDWSEDLIDDHYGTATRFGTYRIVAGN